MQSQGMYPKLMTRRKDASIFEMIDSLRAIPTASQAASLSQATGIAIQRSDELRPRELEELAAAVFARLGGRNVKHTGAHASTDGGVDVWMLNARGDVEIVQCKQIRARVNRTEMVSFAKTMRRQHAVKGHYWAPGDFTRPAREFAASHDMQLYSDRRIREVVDKVFHEEAEAAIRTDEQRPATAAATAAILAHDRARRSRNAANLTTAIFLAGILCVVLAALALSYGLVAVTPGDLLKLFAR